MECIDNKPDKMECVDNKPDKMECVDNKPDKIEYEKQIVSVEPESHPKPLPPIDYDTLVLAGASSKCIVTLGAIQYAYDNFLLKNLQTYIGTSSGAMICYLLAIGYTPV